MASEEEIMPENELARPHHRSKVRCDSKAFSGVAFIASAHFMLYIIVIHYIYVRSRGKYLSVAILSPVVRQVFSETQRKRVKENRDAALIPGCTIW